jgi:hypothetical protein
MGVESRRRPADAGSILEELPDIDSVPDFHTAAANAAHEADSSHSHRMAMAAPGKGRSSYLA